MKKLIFIGLNQQLKSSGVNLDALGKGAAKQLKGETEKGLKDVGKKVKGIMGN